MLAVIVPVSGGMLKFQVSKVGMVFVSRRTFRSSEVAVVSTKWKSRSSIVGTVSTNGRMFSSSKVEIVSVSGGRSRSLKSSLDDWKEVSFNRNRKTSRV